MSEHPMNKKTRVLFGIHITLNVLICPAIIIHKFNIQITNNIIGIIALIIFLMDLILVYYFYKKYSYSTRLRVAMKGFFIYSFIVFLVQFLLNFIGYSGFSNPGAVEKFLYLSYCGVFVYAASLSVSHGYWLNPEIQRIRGIQIVERTEPTLSKGNRIWLIISIIFSFLVLGFGIVLGNTYFFAKSQGRFMMGVFAAMLSLFFGLLFLLKTFQIASSFQQLMNNSKKKKIAIISTFVIGISISSISFIPVMGTPFYIIEAEKEFDAAFNPVFGGNWELLILDSVERHFKKVHFELSDYFIGPRNPVCTQLNDILYFNGSESSFSVDKSISLYFDAYLPPDGYIGMPGENSTIIRIHGGGWVIGDKNSGNVGMMNRYFARQGYTVFDIQYGLNNESDLFSNIPFAPENVQGNFTIDDMMRHIGNFTYYLENHATEFGANLDSVFVSGGSAGGQLTCATALSLASKNYTEFSDAYTIKGMIPFYPANNVSQDFALTSKEEWRNPVVMLNATSPACLIFQGKQDGLIVQSQILQDAYHGFGRTDCAHIQFPFAGHANDIYYPGFYNQIFLYYMERFLYLYH
ncbi:MAG: alpha/beta hydrolase [Promethearchaeota archaeon]